MKKYIISKRAKDRFIAGYKAIEDIIKIGSDNGYKQITIFGKNAFFYLINAIRQLVKVFLIKRKSMVIFQHVQPRREELLFFKIALFIAKIKRCKSICLIHDVAFLRYSRVTKGDKLLFRYDYYVSHNEAMTKELKQFGIDADAIVDFDLWDYLYDEYESKPHYEESVFIAGNLGDDKASYIHKIATLDCANMFYFYGRNNSKNLQNYCGSFQPQVLPSKINQSFGLIWDGDSLGTCSGDYGNYLKYNKPHKTSLIIAARKPIIVWEEAAIARFVKENKIGLTTKTLYEIPNLVRGVSPDDYIDMVERCTKISVRLNEGYYFLNAIAQIEKLIFKTFESKKTNQ